MEGGGEVEEECLDRMFSLTDKIMKGIYINNSVLNLMVCLN